MERRRTVMPGFEGVRDPDCCEPESSLMTVSAREATMQRYKKYFGLAPAISAVMMLSQAGAVLSQPLELGVTDEQRSMIVKHVVKEDRPPVAAPGDFDAAAGATLPLGIELYWMSPAVKLNHLRYTVLGESIVVVVPYTRRIVAVWEKELGSAKAVPNPQR
jgi:hypothetical protein